MDTDMKKPGFYGWWLLFWLFLVYFPIGVSIYGIAVLFPSMIQATGWSRGQISLGITMLYLFIGFGAPLVAWFVNKFNAKRTLIFGSAAMAVITGLIGLIGDIFWAYLGLCVLLGLFMGFVVQIPMQTVIIRWFIKRRALALGLVMGSGAVAGFFGPQLISRVVTASANNWSLGWYVMTAFSLISMVIAFLTIRNSPAELGQYPDGISPDNVAKAAVTGPAGKRVYTTGEDWTVKEAIRTPALWFFILANALGFFLWMIVQTQAPLHLKDRGFDPAMAAFIYGLAIGLSLVGRFAFAALGDRIEPRYLFAAAIICVIISGLLFWGASPEHLWMAYLYPVIGGLGFGMTAVCFAGILANYYGQKAFPGVMGVAMPIDSVVNALAAPVAGFMYDVQHSYFSIMVIATIMACIGFVFTLLARPPRKPVLYN